MISYYNPHIVTAQDYYPFGMLSRADVAGSSKSYRFGFNGKMNDNEVKGGVGNQQDYGMRIYDPRVGKFLSVDPLTKDYPWYTPYQFAGNTPIQAIDLDGLEPAKVGTAGTVVQDKSGQSWKSDGKTWVDNSTLDAVTVSAPKPLSRNFTEWYSHNTKRYDNQNAAYDAWQSYSGYHNGEGKWDRMFRLMASGSKEARREYSFGGYDMYGGAGRVAKLPISQVEPIATEMLPTTERLYKAGDVFKLDHNFIKGVDNLVGDANLGSYTGYTAEFNINTILKDPTNNVSGSVFKNLTEKVESIARSAGMTEIQIEFQLVVNTKLRTNPKYANDLGYHFYPYKTELGSWNVQWIKTLK